MYSLRVIGLKMRVVGEGERERRRGGVISKHLATMEMDLHIDIMIFWVSLKRIMVCKLERNALLSSHRISMLTSMIQ